jgi:hypothetical protein
MGHGGQRLVDRIYGHLGEVRHRAEALEYVISTSNTVANTESVGGL